MTATSRSPSRLRRRRDGGTVALQRGRRLVDYHIRPRHLEALRTRSRRWRDRSRLRPEVVRTGHDPRWRSARRPTSPRSQAPPTTWGASPSSAARDGCCAMGDDPKRAVVPATTCANHTVEPARERRLGLPTGLGVNPQETILRPGPPHRDPPPLRRGADPRQRAGDERCATCRAAAHRHHTHRHETPAASTSRRCSATRRSSDAARPSRAQVVWRASRGNGKKRRSLARPPRRGDRRSRIVDHPPSPGEIHDGYLWGRGAIDMKHMVVMAALVMARLHARGAASIAI